LSATPSLLVSVYLMMSSDAVSFVMSHAYADALRKERAGYARVIEKAGIKVP